MSSLKDQGSGSLTTPCCQILNTFRDYVELLTFKILMFAKKYEQVNDKGLYWEMIKMEIRAFTIAFFEEGS